MDERMIWSAWAVVMLTPFVAIFGALSYAAHLRTRLYTRLDVLWGWLGDGARHLGSGREWVGELEGRRVQVDYFDGITEVRVHARPTVRIGFVREGGASAAPDADGQHPFAIDGDARADEPRAVPAIVGQPGVEDALRVLLADDGASRRAVDVDPREGVGWLVRDLPDRRFAREDGERWVRALVQLARATEAVRA